MRGLRMAGRQRGRVPYAPRGPPPLFVPAQSRHPGRAARSVPGGGLCRSVRNSSCRTEVPPSSARPSRPGSRYRSISTVPASATSLPESPSSSTCWTRWRATGSWTSRSAPRATSRSTPTTRWRTSASFSGRPSPKRSVTRAASCATGTPSVDEALPRRGASSAPGGPGFGAGDASRAGPDSGTGALDFNPRPRIGDFDVRSGTRVVSSSSGVRQFGAGDAARRQPRGPQRPPRRGDDVQGIRLLDPALSTLLMAVARDERLAPRAPGAIPSTKGVLCSREPRPDRQSFRPHSVHPPTAPARTHASAKAAAQTLAVQQVAIIERFGMGNLRSVRRRSVGTHPGGDAVVAKPVGRRTPVVHTADR